MIVGVNLDLDVVDVYSGPSSYLYPPIGVLLKGQEVPALGISEDKNWIQISYPGVPGSVAWVYGPYVKTKKNGRLPVLPAPPTPTPLSTPTINPTLINSTLVAAFITPQEPTRLPTFTQPAPLVIATFLENESITNRVPLGLLIFALGFIGGFGVLISFLRGFNKNLSFVRNRLNGILEDIHESLIDLTRNRFNGGDGSILPMDRNPVGDLVLKELKG